MRDAVLNRAMFGRIAKKYDVTNDVLSFGVHRYWKARLVDAVHPAPGERALDCATGTGEVAFALARAGAIVDGIDACQPMLDEAEAKAGSSACSFSCCDVQELPFADETFDVVTIAWGIRNVADPARGLAEMARVLKPGGRLGVLEFGQARGVIKVGYDVYAQRVLPLLGGLITGDRDAYRWLCDSSSTFAAGDAFLRLLPDTMTARRDVEFLDGVAHLYTARKANLRDT